MRSRSLPPERLRTPPMPTKGTPVSLRCLSPMFTPCSGLVLVGMHSNPCTKRLNSYNPLPSEGRGHWFESSRVHHHKSAVSAHRANSLFRCQSGEVRRNIRFAAPMAGGARG